MELKRETVSVFWPLVLMAILFGCGSQPRSEYPVLAQTVDSDTNLDCTGLEDELLKANALRDAIFEEHGDVIREATLGSAVIFAGDPVAGILSSMLGAATISKATKPYIEAAAAAGLRMEQLLVYKERDDCPSGPTGDAELTDATALIKLHDLELQLRQEEITQKQYVSERKILLDGLR